MQKHVARFQKITKLVEQLLVEKPSDDEHLSIRLKENDELGARGALGEDCAFWCRGVRRNHRANELANEVRWYYRVLSLVSAQAQ